MSCMTRSLLCLLLILLVSNALADCDMNSCEICDEDNFCSRCKIGYYLVPITIGASDGICIPCADGCVNCVSSDICVECQAGFTQGSYTCTKCIKGCTSCSIDPDYCLTCAQNYQLGSNNTCYFKYTIHIIIGSVLVLFLIVFGIRFIFIWFSKRKAEGYYKGEVLDLEIKKQSTHVQDINQIGAIDDNDISKVESKLPATQEERERDFLYDRTVDHIKIEDQISTQDPIVSINLPTASVRTASHKG